MTSEEILLSFVNKHGCNLTVLRNGEHWFHTKEQLQFLSEWITIILQTINGERV